MSTSKKNRVASGLLMVLSGGYAAALGVALHGYGVPVSLLVACCGGAWASLLMLGERAAKAWTTTVHRCTAPGCDFAVQLRHTDAAGKREWQEAAAAHPTHRP